MQTINPSSLYYIYNQSNNNNNNNNNNINYNINNNNNSDTNTNTNNNSIFNMDKYLQPVIKINEKKGNGGSNKKTLSNVKVDDAFELKESEEEELRANKEHDDYYTIDIDKPAPTALPSPTMESKQQQQQQQNNSNNKNTTAQQHTSHWRLASSTCVLGDRIALVNNLEFYKGLKIKGIDYYTDSI